MGERVVLELDWLIDSLKEAGFIQIDDKFYAVITGSDLADCQDKADEMLGDIDVTSHSINDLEFYPEEIQSALIKAVADAEALAMMEGE